MQVIESPFGNSQPELDSKIIEQFIQTLNAIKYKVDIATILMERLYNEYDKEYYSEKNIPEIVEYMNHLRKSIPINSNRKFDSMYYMNFIVSCNHDIYADTHNLQSRCTLFICSSLPEQVSQLQKFMNHITNAYITTSELYCSLYNQSYNDRTIVMNASSTSIEAYNILNQ